MFTLEDTDTYPENINACDIHIVFNEIIYTLLPR